MFAEADYFSDNSSIDNAHPSHYTENTNIAKSIHKILTFSNLKGQKIQLLYTYENPLEVVKNFDLSFCATSWTGSEFICLEPELTKKQIGYAMNTINNDRERSRKTKYSKRGFIIYETSAEAYDSLKK